MATEHFNMYDYKFTVTTTPFSNGDGEEAVLTGEGWEEPLYEWVRITDGSQYADSATALEQAKQWVSHCI